MSFLPIRFAWDSSVTFWGLVATFGTLVDTIIVDSGDPLNRWRDIPIQPDLPPTGDEKFRLDNLDSASLKPVADRGVIAQHMLVGDRVLDDVAFHKSLDVWWKMSHEILGFPFLRQVGVAGFNFRTQRLLMYHSH